MTNHYGRNPMQARINALNVGAKTGPAAVIKTAANIKRIGVDLLAPNRAERRFNDRQNRKSK